MRKPGVLYLVATPIGNLDDLSARAKHVLQTVDLILAEDTRHSRRLLDSIGAHPPLQSYHEHNEQQKADQVCDLLAKGQNIALISDAGTPLMSDPGYVLVKQAHERGLRVSPVPGPMAAITALCGAGLPTDRFAFEGFLPATGAQRRKRLQELRDEPRTLIFYESPHRIAESIVDITDTFGADRWAAYCRELTKHFETILRRPLGEIQAAIEQDPNQSKGELVLVVSGNTTPPDTDTLTVTVDTLLTTLLEQLPVKQAVDLAASLSGGKRNALYQRALALKSIEK